MTIWDCQIGVKSDVVLPPGSDAPMRQAIQHVFKMLTGVDADFCFTGWGGKLDEISTKIVFEQDDATK